MPEFQYQGVDRKGKKVAGKIEADDVNELRVMLRGQGVRPTRISKVSLMNADLGTLLSGGVVRVPMEILLAFTRQLQTMISSGVPLVQALDLLSTNLDHRGLKNIVSATKEKVSSGTYFWEAISAYPAAFPKIYIALVRAGESSGALDVMLRRVGRYLEDSDRLQKMLKSAMMYPIVVINIAIGVIALMLVFVIPKFEELLAGSGQEMPGPTQFVIDLSHAVADNILTILGVVVIGGYLLLRYIKSAEGKAFVDRLLFKAPLFGDLARKGGVARFSRTMATLLSSGMNLVDAIDICRSTIDNAVLEDAVSRIRADVEQGNTLGSVIGKIKEFPPMAVQMITVGENTGNLDQMMEKVAAYYEEEVETAVNGLTKLIEPILLVFLGGIVGGLMIAMYLPVFKMAGGAE